MEEEEAYAKEKKKDQREQTPYKSKSRATWMPNKVGEEEKGKEADKQEM